jgi:hypothetical protein
MTRHIGLTAWLFFALQAFTGPSVARPDSDLKATISITISVMPLRADEIVVDVERGFVRLRGNMDWPDGKTTTSVEIICGGKAFITIDHAEKTDDRWSIDPGLCDQLAKRIQPRR